MKFLRADYTNSFIGSNGEIFEIEKIIARKIQNSQKFYLIKWKGYALNCCSWIPLSELDNFLFFVNDFESKYPKSIGQKSLQKVLVMNKRVRGKKKNKKPTIKNDNNKIIICIDLDKNEIVQKNKENNISMDEEKIEIINDEENTKSDSQNQDFQINPNVVNWYTVHYTGKLIKPILI